MRRVSNVSCLSSDDPTETHASRRPTCPPRTRSADRSSSRWTSSFSNRPTRSATSSGTRVSLGLDAKAIATVGHLLDLPPMADGPAIDTSTFVLGALQPRDAAARERVARIRAAISQADRVIVATDPDREGEAIGAEVWPWIAPGKGWRAHSRRSRQRVSHEACAKCGSRSRDSTVEAAHTRRAIDRLAGWHGTALSSTSSASTRACPQAASRALPSGSWSSAIASTRRFARRLRMASRPTSDRGRRRVPRNADRRGRRGPICFRRRPKRVASSYRHR